MSTDPRYGLQKWKRLRRRILERDGFSCTIKLARCTRFATEVDHIVPTSIGGDFWDEGNLRASCRACNVSRRNQRVNAAAKGLPDPTRPYKPSRDW